MMLSIKKIGSINPSFLGIKICLLLSKSMLKSSKGINRMIKKTTSRPEGKPIPSKININESKNKKKSFVNVIVNYDIIN
jgi:hypothetical protein